MAGGGESISRESNTQRTGRKRIIQYLAQVADRQTKFAKALGSNQATLPHFLDFISSLLLSCLKGSSETVRCSILRII